eukprot:COSAG01_NODE_7808_length_3047_cov_3.984396_4_plen_62_part_00
MTGHGETESETHIVSRYPSSLQLHFREQNALLHWLVSWAETPQTPHIGIRRTNAETVVTVA